MLENMVLRLRHQQEMWGGYLDLGFGCSNEEGGGEAIWMQKRSWVTKLEQCK